MKTSTIPDFPFELADRAETKVSAIRQIFEQLPMVKENRNTQGLPPLIDLSIGQPHLPPNPEVMNKLKEMKPNPISQGYTPAQGEKSIYGLSPIARSNLN